MWDSQLQTTTAIQGLADGNNLIENMRYLSLFSHKSIWPGDSSYSYLSVNGSIGEAWMEDHQNESVARINKQRIDSLAQSVFNESGADLCWIGQ